MMTLKIGEKELNVKFGYEATLKARLLSRMAKMSVEMQEKSGDMEAVEDMLLFIPDVLLIGLQKEHKQDFGYNLDTREGYEEQREKVFALVAEYLDYGEVDAVDFFEELQEEMTRNGFLKKMFEREVEKATEQANTKN